MKKLFSSIWLWICVIFAIVLPNGVFAATYTATVSRTWDGHDSLSCATAHGLATATSEPAGGVDKYTGESKGVAACDVYRHFMTFDLTGIAADQVVDTASLAFVPNYEYGPEDLDVVVCPSCSDSLPNTSFGAVVFTSVGSINHSAITLSVSNNITLNTSAITVNAQNHLAIIGHPDLINASYPGVNVDAFYRMDTGTSPYVLTVTTHTASSSSSSSSSTSGTGTLAGGSGSLIGYHTHCTEFITTGSGSDQEVCTGWDTSVEIPMIRFFIATYGRSIIETIGGVLLLLLVSWIVIKLLKFMFSILRGW